MSEHPSKTVIASLFALEMIDYARSNAEDRAALRDEFNPLLVTLLRSSEPQDRLVVDQEDGAILAFVGDPLEALTAAALLRDELQQSGSKLKLRCGLHLGPVKVLRDAQGRPSLQGDAVQQVQTVMQFSPAGQVLASRAFFEVLAGEQDDDSQLFLFEGMHQDAHGKRLELYQLGAGDWIDQRREAIPARLPPPPATPSPARLARQRRWQLSAAALVMLGLLWLFSGSAPEPEPVQIASSTAAPLNSVPLPIEPSTPQTNPQPVAAPEANPPVQEAESEPVTATPTAPIDEEAAAEETRTEVDAAHPNSKKPSRSKQNKPSPAKAAPPAKPAVVELAQSAPVQPVQLEVTPQPSPVTKPECPPTECWPGGRPKRDR